MTIATPEFDTGEVNFSRFNTDKRDDQLFGLVQQEFERQRDGLELIASENFTSQAVMEAVGSVLTNKYAEGYPGKRYYGGCEVVDEVERLAISRAKELFRCAWANVQPHSGSGANLAVYYALLEPGDTVLGMDLAHGGHLTHGSPVNFSGMNYRVVGYPVDKETERIDYDVVRALAKEHKPKLIIAGASAYSRTLDFAEFRSIADEVGAYLLADIAHIAGLVAAGLHPSPIPHAHVVTSTTHKTLRGPRSGIVLSDDEEIGKKVDKMIFPGTQGGPLEHAIAGKAVAFFEALQPEFKTYSQAIIDNAQRLASEMTRARLQARLGRHRQPPLFGRPASAGYQGQWGDEAAGRRPHHHQQEHDAFRPGKAVGHLGHPRRHAGRHHARLQSGGDAQSRRTHRPRPARRRRRQRQARGRRAGAALPDALKTSSGFKVENPGLRPSFILGLGSQPACYLVETGYKAVWRAVGSACPQRRGMYD